MIGKTVLHYKIIEKLGQGGMGVVYLAEDTKLERQVAIKFLPPHIAGNSDERKRFEIEAKAAAALNHPNIATIHAIEQTDDDVFIVMEYIDGQELKEEVRNKKWEAGKVIEIASQIAQGLRAAHEKGIVHRDIKSSNIMITDKGQIKIMDFGLAKIGAGSQLTRDHSTLGTAAYMSPEQTRGDEVDHRSDIWSFGVLLYEMLTGTQPFKGDYEQAVIYSILNEDPKAVNTIRDDIPDKIVRLLNKALAKDANNRYQKTDEIISELKQLQNVVSGTDKYADKFRSHFLLTRPIIVLFLLMLCFILYWVFFREISVINKYESTDWENSIAVLPFANSSVQEEQAYFCDGMTKQVLASLSKLNKMKVISHTSVTKYQNTEKTIPEISRELQVENILLGSVSKFGDRLRVQVQLIRAQDDAHLWAENYDYKYDIEKLFAIYDDISEKITLSLLKNISIGNDLKSNGIKPANTRAYELYLKGQHYHSDKFMNGYDRDDFKIAEEFLKKAIKEDPGYVMPYAELADLYNTAYNNLEPSSDEKSELMRLQDEYLAKAVDINENVAIVQKVKALVYMAKDEYNLAYTHFVKAVMIDPNDPIILSDIGWFYDSIGLNDLASAYYSKSIQLAPMEASNWAWRAMNYLYKFEEQDKAEEDIKRALALDPHQAQALQCNFWFYIRRREISAAEMVYDKYKEAFPNSTNLKRFKAFLLASNDLKKEALKYELESHDTMVLYCYMNDQEEALARLLSYFGEEFLSGNHTAYFHLKTNAFYENIRNDSRYQQLLSKHKTRYNEYLHKYGTIKLLE